LFVFGATDPLVGHGLLIHEFIDNTKTHRRQKYSSERVISSSQRPLPDNKQHPQQTDIHALGGIRTNSLRMRAATNLHFISCGHWDRNKSDTL